MCTYSASKTHLSVAQTLSTTLFQNHSQLQISLDFLTYVQPVVLCVWSQDLGSSADTEGDTAGRILLWTKSWQLCEKSTDSIQVMSLYQLRFQHTGIYVITGNEVPGKKKSSVCTLVVKTQLCTPALLIEQVISMESAVSKDFKAE